MLKNSIYLSNTKCQKQLSSWVAVAVTVVIAVTVLTSDSHGVAAPNARLQGAEWAKVLRKEGLALIG